MATFVRGRSAGFQPLSRRTLPAFAGGLVVTLLALVVTAAQTTVFHAAPSGWNRDGTLVGDRDLGGLFLMSGKIARPVANRTTLLLLGGPAKRITWVSHRRLAAAGFGPSIGISDVPAIPPALTDGFRWTACVLGPEEVAVLLGSRSDAGPAVDDTTNGIAVRGARTQGYFLVAGGRKFPIDEAALAHLYDPSHVAEVPESWLALLPSAGRMMSLIRVPAAEPGTRAGELGGSFIRTPDNARYVLEQTSVGPVLHPVTTDTGADLLTGLRHPELHRPIDVSRSDIRDLPVRDPVDDPAWPAHLPTLPARAGDAVCALSDGSTRIVSADSVAAGRREIARNTVEGVRVTVSAVGDASTAPAALLQAAGADGDISEHSPVYLLAEGRAYPATSPAPLQRLGYDLRKLHSVSRSLLDLLPAGSRLESPE
ncbi:type VII secretion protein EccB [Frankia sp. AiPs1]|nr:type VII secretion protein EccB [Frankia sp. AiPs1]